MCAAKPSKWFSIHFLNRVVVQNFEVRLLTLRLGARPLLFHLPVRYSGKYLHL